MTAAPIAPARARLDRAVLACVVLAIVIFSIVWRPPLDVGASHRAQTTALALIVLLLAALPTFYLSVRFTGRRSRTFWYVLSASGLLSLAAALFAYQNLRATYSAQYEGTLVVTGVDEDLTVLGKTYRAQEPEVTSSALVQRIGGKPEIVWDPPALRRHARRMELQYLLCEALLAISAGALVGAWRSTSRVAADVAIENPAETRAGAVSSSTRRFSVALSFPGEVRDRVRGIAGELEGALGRNRIFYDAWYRGELARPDMDTYLRDIYKLESDLVVVVLCADYERKEWCGLEWRVVRELVKSKESRRIMLLRLDDAHLADLLSIDGFLDIDSLSDEEVAREILARVRADAPHPGHMTRG